MSEYNPADIRWAERVGGQTLVGGFEQAYPRKYGNCFDVIATDGESYKIVNFYVENFKEAVKRGVALPVKMLVLGEKTAIIFDERIPCDWYRQDYCVICCPDQLLPHPQKMALERSKLDGSLRQTGGITIIDPSKCPDLRTDDEKRKQEEAKNELLAGWTINEELGVGVVNREGDEKLDDANAGLIPSEAIADCRAEEQKVAQEVADKKFTEEALHSLMNRMDLAKLVEDAFDNPFPKISFPDVVDMGITIINDKAIVKVEVVPDNDDQREGR